MKDYCDGIGIKNKNSSNRNEQKNKIPLENNLGKMKHYCETCDRFIQNIKPHLKTLKHERNKSKFIFSHLPCAKIIKKHFCNSCKVRVKNFKVHAKSKKHFNRKYQCKFKECISSKKGTAKEYKFTNINHKDPKEFIQCMRDQIEEIIKSQGMKNVKIQLALNVEFVKPLVKEKTITSWFNTGLMISVIQLESNVLQKMIDKINEKISQFTREGSGWVISKILDFHVKIAKYEPLKGSSYIPLPKKYQNSVYKLINMKNTDHECFKWCIARSRCLDERNPQNVSKRVKLEASTINWQGLKFPMPVNSIDKFENQNDISVNVYAFDDKLELYPLRTTVIKKSEHVNLLMITEDDNKHYVLMKNLSPFVNKKHHGQTFVCSFCLHSFYKKENHEKHELECSIHTPVRMELSKDPVRFKNYQKQIRHPFVIYADFESTLKKIDSVQPDPKESYTMDINKHIPNSFCVYTKCEVDKYSKLKTYNGSQTARAFVSYLTEEVKRIYDIMKKNTPMNLTARQKAEYYNACNCYVCHQPFTKENNKVRDHNHLTGEFRGAAHWKCNLKIRNPSFVPVFIHNLSKYDAHLFVKALGEVPGKLGIIPQTDETYISMSQNIIVDYYTDKQGTKKPLLREIRFLDSFRFMASSIDKLSSNLKDENFKELSKFVPDKDKFKLLKRKGIYPYEWMDNISKFECTKLPPIKSFYSKLKNENISKEDYDHACKVWETFKCETFKDYHMLYQKLDVILLADIFENFRETCMKTYGLDPAQYYTAPGLSWDALLKYTKIVLDPIQDPDILLFLERGIRGGISTITTRYSKANNPYISETYESNKPTNYIAYLDANNLYGYAMSQKLPTGKFKWVKNVTELDPPKGKGYILEVDLEYPKELHDAHNDYPLAAENIMIDKVSKLTPNLNNKEKYVIHYEALQQCLDLGLKLTKVHRVLEYSEMEWMKPYIDLNTEKRKLASNEFEKDFYKLMNNSVYGKTMENIRNRVDVKLVKTDEELKKMVNKPNFETFKIFNHNLIACHMKRTKLTFDKPIYVGMAILDLSKTLMYDFHYNFIKTKYKDKAKLLFTDTDSLCYSIQTRDLYKDLNKQRDLFDTSNYPKEHFLYSDQNKKVLGKFKDETNGVPITEFVGLRSKLYAYKTLDCNIQKRAKGIGKSVVDKEINLEDYKRALFKEEVIHRKMNIIQSKNHKVYTTQINKVALCGKDDKRCIMKDMVNTLALGHYKI